MGRQGGRSSSRGSARPTTTASPKAAPAPAPAAPRPAPQAAPQAAPAASQTGGPSLLGNIASTAAGVAIGHVVADKLIGGHDAPAGAAPQQLQVPSECSFPFRTYNECMQSNNGQPSFCQWAFDKVQLCMKDPAAYSKTNSL